MKKNILAFASFLITLFACNISSGQTITTIVGTGVPGFSGDWGPPTSAQLNFPGYLSFGGAGYGSLYIGDRLNYRVREVNLAPVEIFTWAGSGINGYSGDGGAATAANITIPGGICVDIHDNVYFADYDNHRIRKVTPAGIISTFAGNGTAGYSGDGGPATAAQFDHPNYIIVDSSGNFYIADQHNHRIRKVDPLGIITTVAGTGSSAFSGDGGPAAAAGISFPNYVRMDRAGNLYITDNGNHRVRKINTSGIITTIAGTGTLGYSGDGGAATAAELNYPGGIAVDSIGNVLICDCYNNVIREISAVTGKIYTVAGNGTGGYSGDGGPATAAELNLPVDIAVDNSNNIYVADWYNSRIRKITPVVLPSPLNTSSTQNGISFKVYPNPSTGVVSIEGMDKLNAGCKLVITDISGCEVYSSLFPQNVPQTLKLDLTNYADGNYIITVKSDKTEYTTSIRKQ